MSADRENEPEIRQDPGIPGWKTPEQLPPQDEPEVERVPESEQPDVDDEGQMAGDEPGGSKARQRFAMIEIAM